MSIDPTTPINPGQGRLPQISLAPSAIQRVSPEQQRNSPHDQQQPEEEAEESFDELLDEAEIEDIDLAQMPSPTAPGDVVAQAVPLTPHAPVDSELLDTWDDAVVKERRARNEDSGDDDGPHIDIVA